MVACGRYIYTCRIDDFNVILNSEDSRGGDLVRCNLFFSDRIFRDFYRLEVFRPLISPDPV